MAEEQGDPLAAWTERLLGLGAGISPQDARSFVRDLYTHAQATLDAERAEAEAAREE
ncbi:hypothetical protein HHL19_23125 [Streptomyces sp. R302]|uniref:hypothetical protein n=1 Tax=unclassified Streptomyces TaxID=2593676 RepID=UPI00145D8CA1|nr:MULTISPECIES: hypothetical protein [unclassified Streptomyces]NML51842.1 hypothetical protein [Streptomyces sp. R301]NML81462.1 hypothetical protein [Streptomyces sp. R302]